MFLLHSVKALETGCISLLLCLGYEPGTVELVAVYNFLTFQCFDVSWVLGLGVQWLSVGLVIERSLLQLPAGALSSQLGQLSRPSVWGR